MDSLQSQRDKLYNKTDKSDVLAQPMALQLHQADIVFSCKYFFLLNSYENLFFCLKQTEPSQDNKARLSAGKLA